MSEVENIAGDKLRSLIERIERLEEEKRATQSDIKDIYAEAKSAGFDTKVMKMVIRLRRMDNRERDEEETILDIYKRVLDL